MSRQRLFLFYLLFIFSGALGLVYEVLWQRLITLQIGVSALSVSVVLAAYMCGLAMGAGWGSKLAQHTEQPGRLYGILEFAIGLYALALPLLIEAIQPFFAAIYQLNTSPLVAIALQGAILMLLLLPPTLCMGASFPLLVQALIPAGEDVPGDVSRLYAANALGAVLGCLGGCFLLLREFGLSTGINLAAIMSLLIGMAGWYLGRRRESVHWEDIVEGERSEFPASTGRYVAPKGLLLAAVALTGASTMIYEVAWSRLLAVQLGSSIYSFTLMLATFLAGLFLGAGGAQRLLRRYPDFGLRGFVLAQAFAIVAVVATRHLYPELPYYFVSLFHFFGSLSSAFATQFMISALVMLPATIALGAALPMAMAAVAKNGGIISAAVGRTYMFNTLGAVLGTLVAGFGLLPLLGTSGAITLGLVTNLVALLLMGLLTLGHFRKGVLGAVPVLLVLAVFVKPSEAALKVTGGAYRYADDLQGGSREDIADRALGAEGLLFFKEGLNSTVTVGQNPESGNIWLANNGKVDASTSGDLSTQLMLAHLPMWVKPEAKKAAVVGLASGITLGALLQHDVEEVRVFEIEEAIVEGSHFFDEHNNRPLEDARVRLEIADARRHFQFTDKYYDLVISEPSNPWVSGVSNLFTDTFWRLLKGRLAEGGVLCQWFQLYELGPQELKVLLRTFNSVFPHSYVFGSLSHSDLIVVGSNEALDLGVDEARELFTAPQVRESLGRVEVMNEWDLMTWYLFDEKGLYGMVGDGPINTDDNAYIEFHAPLTLYTHTDGYNTKALVSHREPIVSRLYQEMTREQIFKLSEAYLKRHQFKFSAETLEVYRDVGGELERFEKQKKTILQGFEAYPYRDVAD